MSTIRENGVLALHLALIVGTVWLVNLTREIGGLNPELYDPVRITVTNQPTVLYPTPSMPRACREIGELRYQRCK